MLSKAFGVTSNKIGRKVRVRGDKAGIFQGWFQSIIRFSDGSQVANPVGLVEFPDGSVGVYKANLLKFLEPPADKEGEQP